MSKNTYTKGKVSSDSLDFEVTELDGEGKDVVDIAQYRQAEDAEASAFDKVMSQMSIADRAAFDKKYDQLWHEASNDNELLSVYLCEIDFFKAYVDNYGQQGASFMLLVVGLALKSICDRYGCFLAHYQKEEFGILMKGGSEEEVLEIAEALRQAVEGSQTEHKFSSVNRVVTLSIGVSSIYPNSMAVLMQKANHTLHQAKLCGRNQVYGDFPKKNDVYISEKPETEIEEALEVAVVVEEEEESHFQQFLLDMEISDQAALKKSFGALWKECLEEKELLSMVICGFDFFKPFVEHYGKEASEDALLIIACALAQTCEKLGGFIYYLGDENYIILLKGGNATRALKVGEQVHQFVAESCTEHKYSEVGDVVTVSIGLSNIFPNETNSIEILKEEAKKAFHAAIKAGRNQTSVSY